MEINIVSIFTILAGILAIIVFITGRKSIGEFPRYLKGIIISLIVLALFYGCLTIFISNSEIKLFVKELFTRETTYIEPSKETLAENEKENDSNIPLEDLESEENNNEVKDTEKSTIKENGETSNEKTKELATETDVEDTNTTSTVSNETKKQINNLHYTEIDGAIFEFCYFIACDDNYSYDSIQYTYHYPEIYQFEPYYMFKNVPLNSELKGVYYKDGIEFYSNIVHNTYWEDGCYGNHSEWIKADGPGAYSVEIYYNGILVLASSCIFY